MAKLRIFKSIENDVYKVQFVNDPLALGETDKQLMQKFGEPEINMGGVFMQGGPNEFTFPDEFVKIRSDFPLIKSFDSTVIPFNINTTIKIDAYIADISSLWSNAFVDLRAMPDTFTKEQIVEI